LAVMFGKAGWVQAKWFLQSQGNNWVMVGVLWRFVASYPGVMRPSYMCWGPEGCDVAVVYTGIWC